MTLNTAGIFAAVAGLTITGLTIKDIDEIPFTVTDRDCPVMFPAPAGGVQATQAEMMTFGGATERYWEVTRQFRWNYLHAPLGADRYGVFAYHPAMAAKSDAIIEALCELDVAGVDIMTVDLTDFGPVPAPDGTMFHGFGLTMTVREKINP